MGNCKATYNSVTNASDSSPDNPDVALKVISNPGIVHDWEFYANHRDTGRHRSNLGNAYIVV